MTRTSPPPLNLQRPTGVLRLITIALPPGSEFNTMNYGHTEHYLGIDL